MINALIKNFKNHNFIYNKKYKNHMKHIKQFEELGFDDPMIKSKWDKNTEEQKQEQERRENDEHSSYFTKDGLDKLAANLDQFKNKLSFDKKYLFKMNKEDFNKVDGVKNNISEMLKLYLFENSEEWQSEFKFNLSAFHEYDMTFNIIDDAIDFNVHHIDNNDAGNFYIDLDDFIEFYNIHLSHKLIN